MIEYIHEPTDLQCGQAVLAMVLGKTVEEIVIFLQTPRCWHWSLYADGTFYDPEHGVMSDFPSANRKYYWKLEKQSVL